MTVLRESPWYQEILQEGRLEGKEEGLQHERSLVLKQLTRKLGPVPPEARSQIDTFSVFQLEALGEALLDFSQPSDLITWLQAHLQL